MNTRHIICITTLMAFSLTGYCNSNEVTFELPPESLEQWYKPKNKRQAWLHIMFKLRREMQAINEYAKTADFSSMEKWLTRLDKHYNKMGDMVPEWNNRLKPALISDLKNFTQQKDLKNIRKAMNSIRRNCNDCHNDFQSVATILYRTPNYDDIEIIDHNKQKQTLDENMDELSKSVNQLLIALDDNRKTVALKARNTLSSQLNALSSSCNSCHKGDPYPEERILGIDTQKQLLMLKSHIEQDRVRDSQKLTGQIAVKVCSRCHNIHRTLYDIRKAILPED